MAWRLLFFDKNNGEKFSTENPERDLMDLLIEKTKILGHMLTFTEASEDPEMVQPNNYAFYFGSFGEAAKIAWRRAKPPDSSPDGLTEYGSKVVEALRKTRQLTGKPYRREVNWMSEFKERKRRVKGVRWTMQEARDALSEFYKQFDRLPSQEDVKHSDILPSWGVLAKYLGPKSEWQAIIDGENVATTTEAKDPLPVCDALSVDVDDADIQEDETPSPGLEAPPNITEEPPQQDDCVEVETSQKGQGDLVTIELKITLPGREKPVLVTLTV